MSMLAESVSVKENGSAWSNQDALLVNHHDPSVNKKVKISKLYEFDGLNKVEVNDATVGSIVAISGIADIHIGDTICSPDSSRTYSIPEDFGTYNCYAVPCKRQSTRRSGR